MRPQVQPPSGWRDSTTLQSIFLGLIAVSILSVLFLYRHLFGFDTFEDVKHAFFPCQSPLTYQITDIDQRFNVSEEEFSEAINQATTLWEQALQKNLFEERENGALSINLIYDYRQASTTRLQELGLNIQENNESYDRLKNEYDTVYQNYLTEKASLDARLSAHETRSQAYEAEVARTNANGGAKPKEYEALEAERQILNAEAAAINADVRNINATADTVNTLADALNDLADRLNLSAERYNKIGNTLGDEFIEGTFAASNEGDAINIYQYEDEDKLIRVLAHELGHALGLDHVDDPNAIMYRLNDGEELELTSADITALKQRCRLK